MDDSRTFLDRRVSGDTGDRGRPLRIFLWYPSAVTKPADPMRLGEYVYVEPDEQRFAAFNRELVKYDEQGVHNTARNIAGDGGEVLFEALLKTKTGAVKSAEPAPGSHPLVLFSLGQNDIQQENTIFFEYLASHGYAVATVPHLGTRAGIVFLTGSSLPNGFMWFSGAPFMPTSKTSRSSPRHSIPEVTSVQSREVQRREG